MAGEKNRITAAGSARAPSAGPTDDERLLDRVLGGDPQASEEAFRALVARHGPMVLGVCRQVLGREHDAEDVFQATFLILARSASTIRERRALGGWLHGVAHRLAVRVKAGAARRRAKEMEAAELSTEGSRSERGWGDLRPVLHEEVNRLPEVYRNAVVLCYLEGRTNEEAAALLRWPVGTVKGRLSRARVLLRSRLTRRGLALSAALLMARSSEQHAIAEVVPEELAGATIRAVAGLDGPAPDRVRGLVTDDLGSAARPTRRPGTTLLLVSVAVVVAAVSLGGAAAAASASRGAAYRQFLGFFIDRSGATIPGACHGSR